ncbi:hypothetical protein, partial [Citrobacter amalonaticus]|uniref:hypothetical protein n=1 Tax=Citrobacter amalonaticus TaxID=35703 RepID=UPI001E2C3AE8
SLFQSLNIEVQDVSPDVATRHAVDCRSAIRLPTTFTIRDKPNDKNNRYLLRPFFCAFSRKNGLKRDQFNTLLIDRKERCATYKCSTNRFA